MHILGKKYTENKVTKKKKEEEQGALILLFSSSICFAASTLSIDIHFHDI